MSVFNLYSPKSNVCLPVRPCACSPLCACAPVCACLCVSQVLVSYGPKSNGELLLAYGVIPATRNPHDSVPLLLALSPEDPLFALKQRVLQRANSAG